MGVIAGVALTLVYINFSEPNYSSAKECEVKELQKNQTNYTRSLTQGYESNSYVTAVRYYCKELMKSKSED